jgi:hypothetical protein
LVGREHDASASTRPLIHCSNHFFVNEEIAVEPTRQGVLNVDVPPKCRERALETNLNSLTSNNEVGPPRQEKCLPQFIGVNTKALDELRLPVTSDVTRGVEKDAVNVHCQNDTG